jgi:hypothetical protein
MFDFPAAPVLNDIFEPNGPGSEPSYTFDGVAWIFTPAAGAPLSLTALVPAFLVAGGNDRTVRILGFGFTPQSIIHVDGVAVATAFASSEELQFDALASAETAPRIAAITVRNGAIESNELPLNFVAVPVLTSVDPDSISVSGPPLPVTCIGTGFVDGSTVWVNYQEMPTTFVSTTELTATVEPTLGTPGDQLFIHVQTGRMIMSNQMLFGFTA